MSPEEFRRHGHAVIDWIANYQASIRDYPVLPPVQPGDLTALLPAHPPDQPEPMDQILAGFDRLILPHVTHWNHPRFHSFFAISSSPPGVLAEALIAGLNMQHMLWIAGPAGVELEQLTARWLLEWMGLAEPAAWFPQIFDTASISTIHGIAAAREFVDPSVRQHGHAKRYTVYTSQFAHSSVDKACILLGIGHENLRKVPVDAQYRMIPAELARMIAADRAQGATPICVVPTVGTTGVTSVDPVGEAVRIAHEEGLWVHVDAAYGGAAAIVPEFRSYLDGMDEADSFVVNPHKWLFTPIDLSLFYTRHPAILRRAFGLIPDYLDYGHNPQQVDLMNYGAPLGRRFRSLKLWMVMRAYGRDGFIERIRQHIDWAREFAARIQADPRFELAAPTTMGLICFRLKAGDAATKRLVETINASGFAFLSQTTVDGAYTIRWAIGTFACTRADLEAVWEKIRALADQPA